MILITDKVKSEANESGLGIYTTLEARGNRKERENPKLTVEQQTDYLSSTLVLLRFRICYTSKLETTRSYTFWDLIARSTLLSF